MELNQRERLVEKHLMSLLGREPGGTPCPPRLLLFQLGALDSARLSCRVSVDSLDWEQPGATATGNVWRTRPPTATRPRCSWGPAPYADLVAESGSGSAPRLTPHFPLRPAWEVSFPFCWPPATRSASGVSNFLGVVGSRGSSSPPAHSAGGTEAARVSPRASVGSARAGWGRGRGSGTAEEAGPLLPPVCSSSKATRPLCPFSRGETCTQWWKTAAVPSFH